jgi:hypothetical protein
MIEVQIHLFVDGGVCPLHYVDSRQPTSECGNGDNANICMRPRLVLPRATRLGHINHSLSCHSIMNFTGAVVQALASDGGRRHHHHLRCLRPQSKAMVKPKKDPSSVEQENGTNMCVGWHDASKALEAVAAASAPARKVADLIWRFRPMPTPSSSPTKPSHMSLSCSNKKCSPLP